MSLRAPEAHTRSVLKAVSWRLLGSVDTFILSYVFTHKLVYAFSISGTEVFTKIALYYFHERLWTLVPWGRPKVALNTEPAPVIAPSAPQPA
jgi:uncharacterized membrane protein